MTYQPIENNGTSSSRLEANVAIFSSPTTPRSETSLARSSDSIGARHAFGRLPPRGGDAETMREAIQCRRELLPRGFIFVAVKNGSRSFPPRCADLLCYQGRHPLVQDLPTLPSARRR
jgi:hypothetical protein